MSTNAAINRSGKLWAFLQFPITRIALAAASVVAFIFVVQSLARLVHVRDGTIAAYLVDLLFIIGTCVIYVVYVRVIEKRFAAELGASGAVREFGIGFLTGAVLFCLVMLILWLMGALSIGGLNPWAIMLVPLMGALVAGFIEEILVRGILFRIIEESLGSWVALVLSAVMFGLLHVFNPGATTISTIAIALEAGILLAAVYMYTRRLWMVIGLHAAWDFTEGGVFGASDSGHRVRGLFNSQFHGSALITGGKFGPEASVIAVLVCLAAGVGFIILAHRKGHIVRPFWQRVEEPGRSQAFSQAD